MEINGSKIIAYLNIIKVLWGRVGSLIHSLHYPVAMYYNVKRRIIFFQKSPMCFKCMLGHFCKQREKASVLHSKLFKSFYKHDSVTMLTTILQGKLLLLLRSRGWGRQGRARQAMSCEGNLLKASHIEAQHTKHPSSEKKGC